MPTSFQLDGHPAGHGTKRHRNHRSPRTVPLSIEIGAHAC